jgi:hypothetical protein
MTIQITNTHLAFVEEAKEAFEQFPLYETYMNAEGSFIALRFGADRDCVMVYELGEPIANFVQQMDPCPQPRKVVREFAHDMEKLLKENEHKSGWENEDVVFLGNQIAKNFEKLAREFKKIDINKQEITTRCANIANFAMMIADNEGNHL